MNVSSRIVGSVERELQQEVVLDSDSCVRGRGAETAPPNALSHQAQYVLCDKPTTELDPATDPTSTEASPPSRPVSPLDVSSQFSDAVSLLLQVWSHTSVPAYHNVSDEQG